MVRSNDDSNDDMGKDCVIEFTPPTTEEIRKARALANGPTPGCPHPCPADYSDPVRLQKMIALCRKAGAIASKRYWKTGVSRLCDGQETAFPASDADQRSRTFNLLIKSRRIQNRRAPHFCTERINDLPIAKPERKRFTLVLSGDLRQDFSALRRKSPSNTRDRFGAQPSLPSVS